MCEDTDGDGFRDSGNSTDDLSDPNSTPLQQGLVAWYPLMAMPPMCRAMEKMRLYMEVQPLRLIDMERPQAYYLDG